VTLGLAVAALWGSGDLLAALAGRRFGAFRTLATAQAAELGVCVAFWLAFRPPLPGVGLTSAILVLAGVLTAGAYGALYRGLVLGPVTLVGPIASAYAVGPTILAVVVLGEELSAKGAIGSVAAIGGVAIVTATQRRAKVGPEAKHRSGVPFGLAAMMAFGLSSFLIAAYADAVGWFPPLLISRLGVAVILVVASVRFRPVANIQHADARGAATLLAVITGFANLAGTAVYARAGELGLVAVVSPVSALFPVVPIVGAYLFFGERPARIQLLGVAVIIVGLVLLG
jgi:transporter family protein